MSIKEPQWKRIVDRLCLDCKRSKRSFQKEIRSETEEEIEDEEDEEDEETEENRENSISRSFLNSVSVRVDVFGNM